MWWRWRWWSSPNGRLAEEGLPAAAAVAPGVVGVGDRLFLANEEEAVVDEEPEESCVLDDLQKRK